MIEKNFDTAFVARLALREKQIQQTYRPVIGVHKWFARRPGSLFRALLLAEFAEEVPLPRAYFRGHDLSGRVVGDPFIGGGTPVLEANRLGCAVVGSDINPMAWWIVRQELASLDLPAFERTAGEVMRDVEGSIGHLYATTCRHCGCPDAPVKYFLWVKEQACAGCGDRQPLFSSYLLAKNERHPNYVLVCPSCEALNEVARLADVPNTRCRSCDGGLRTEGPARRSEFRCRSCGYANRYPVSGGGPPAHRLFAMEYHCPGCNPSHRGRFFKEPEAEDLHRYAEAEKGLNAYDGAALPDDPIPPGDETTRLHRWGYHRYRDLFNARQLLGLTTLVERIATVEDDAVRHALLTVFSDSLRYQNLLCRYDAYVLKVLDVFSVHGFPVSLVQCESALIGIPGVGSGGFRHFTEKYARAKAYCEQPYEFALGRGKRKVSTLGERIGARFTEEPPAPGRQREAFLRAAPADTLPLPPASLDAVLTDPPYFANVQYAELMDFCYVWLRRQLAAEVPAFRASTTRAADELTVNQTLQRDASHYAEGMSRVFRRFADALKPGAPFAFTFHHNRVEAYVPIAVALLDAGLACTASLAAPAEMGASIHINGTGSSVLDTVFVCRAHGRVPAADFDPDEENLRRLLDRDARQLTDGGVSLTQGDFRCLLLGHLTRLVIWAMRPGWDEDAPVERKLARVQAAFFEILTPEQFERLAVKRVAERAPVREAPPLVASLEPVGAFDDDP